MISKYGHDFFLLIWGKVDIDIKIMRAGGVRSGGEERERF